MSRALLLAGDGDVPPKPYFTVATVVGAIVAMPGQDGTPDEKRHVVLEEVKAHGNIFSFPSC